MVVVGTIDYIFTLRNNDDTVECHYFLLKAQRMDLVLSFQRRLKISPLVMANEYSRIL